MHVRHRRTFICSGAVGFIGWLGGSMCIIHRLAFPNAYPAIGGIEDRHIEDKHRIVNLSPTLEDFSPAPLGISAQSFNFQIHFV